MKLSKLNYYTLPLLLALASCSNEEVTPGAETAKGGPDTEFYISLDISFPETGATRSETDQNGGTSDVTGSTKENTIQDIRLYFFDATGSGATDGQLLFEFSTAATLQLTDKDVDNNYTQLSGQYKLIQPVDIDDLKKLMRKKVNIYALANLGTNYPSVSTTTSPTMESTFLDGVINGAAMQGYVQPYKESSSNDGRICPMGSAAKFTADLSDVGKDLGDNPSTGAVIAAFESLFRQDYRDERNELLGKKWVVNDGSNTTISLERMVARLDYQFPNTGYNVLNVYLMNNAVSTVAACNRTSDNCVYLKVNKITIKNIGDQEYYFRHTAAGNYSQVTGETSPFGIERNSNDNATYRWVADADWSNTSKNFLSDVTDNADNIVKNIGAMTPWYYLSENTVKSTSAMSTDNCTYLEFDVVLWNASTGVRAPYTSNTEEDVRITYTSNRPTKPDYFQKLTYGADRAYHLTYRYMIPHNIAETGTNVDGSSGSTGAASTLKPMQYGIVRNNVYQISLAAIEALPNAGEPEKADLTVNVKVTPWTYEGHEESW